MQPVTQNAKKEVASGRHDYLIGKTAIGYPKDAPGGQLTTTQVGTAIRAAAKRLDEFQDFVWEIEQDVAAGISLGECVCCYAGRDRPATVMVETEDGLAVVPGGPRVIVCENRF